MKKKLKTLIVIATLGIGLVIASQQIEFTIGARENNFNHDGKVLWSSWGVEPNFDYIAYSKGTKENKIFTVLVYGFEADDQILYRHDIVLK